MSLKLVDETFERADVDTLHQPPQDKKTPIGGGGGDMNDAVSRYELDAKLESLGAQMDKRIDRMELMVSQATAGMAQTEQRIEATVHRIEDKLDNAKWWAIGTAIAALGLFFAMMQYGNSMYDTGRESTKAEPPTIIVNVPPTPPASK